ncbi:MAG TPA: cyclic pyranopterin monophosphate synthase MoaC [Candidatus Brocadiaceae bacterium]|nr:cyclic pyranopterin monophosphate synthase MoaC [Candidatus Brocadiaceae bacterium]
MTQLTHFDEHGASRMVDISEKAVTERVAVAHAKIIMKPETFRLIMDKKVQKGDVLEVARIAGIMAAKQTSGLIPLCHPLNLTSVKIDYKNNDVDTINVFAEAQVTGKTGVEMEAIVAASVCAITVYDMCKAADKRMVISDIHLVKKSGGKSGTFIFDKDSNMPA